VSATRRRQTYSPRTISARPFSLFFLLALFAYFAGNSYAQDLTALETAIRTGTSEQKRDALFQIRNLRSEVASRTAVAALSDSDPIVRATAAGSVVFLPKREAAKLVLPMLSDKDEFVRKEAAYAIAAIGDDSAMLGEHNYGDIADGLWNALEKEKSSEVRSAIIIAMGSSGGLKSVERLVWYLGKPEARKEEFLRRSAVRSVGYIAETLRSGERKMHYLRLTEEELRELDYAEEFRYFEAATNLFIKYLQDPKEVDDVKREAAKALGHIKAERSVPALTSATRAADPYLAEIAREALAKIANTNPAN
jgi:HEAT repeat protein